MQNKTEQGVSLRRYPFLDYFSELKVMGPIITLGLFPS